MATWQRSHDIALGQVVDTDDALDVPSPPIPRHDGVAIRQMPDLSEPAPEQPRHALAMGTCPDPTPSRSFGGGGVSCAPLSSEARSLPIVGQRSRQRRLRALPEDDEYRRGCARRHTQAIPWGGPSLMRQLD
eukprot:CAMPEP_0183588644 /NCGR_PEP_ID=MMETSP0371-20130417/161203_1 /TAXON_ID=268820 /ORGANISM="Peridinium aciculiferum, Strain PAER-2" /LENGTH=131 /DNA_ID=CAMNT_0025799915 /DNA_START=125 /DNA_END=517 /DNA_ORIENTATION=+